MSAWTYITGAITVYPFGRTQPEKRYILDTVLEHLPRVSGSEEDMYVHVIQNAGYTESCSHNEFGEWTNNRRWDDRRRMQSYYTIVLQGSLRDCYFEDTLKELNKWLNRLAKRVDVNDILVKLTGRSEVDHMEKSLIISDPKPYLEMGEWPSWLDKKSGGEPNWCEYLIWDRAKDSDYPAVLAYKYFNDPENDAEVERRLKYARGETP